DRPVRQVANDVQQAAGDKQHSQHIDGHQFGGTGQVRDNHRRSKRRGNFETVELRAVGTFGKPFEGFQECTRVMVLTRPELAAAELGHAQIRVLAPILASRTYRYEPPHLERFCRTFAPRPATSRRSCGPSPHY
ncbi:hypothetical protein BHE74_00007373, partial [Ensete ventricosum]